MCIISSQTTYIPPPIALLKQFCPKGTYTYDENHFPMSRGEEEEEEGGGGGEGGGRKWVKRI